MRFTNAEGAGGQCEDKNMFNRIDTGPLKRGLLLFWALWLAVVVTTNVLDALQALGELLVDPSRDQAFLFAGVIAWEGLAASLFGWAFTSYRNRPLIQETATIWACGVNLALWAAFQVLDEVFLAYQPEGVHRGIFGNQILTLLMLYLLPTRDP